jgi:single-strand selective monofunctional uracil DNA glycosylase
MNHVGNTVGFQDLRLPALVVIEMVWRMKRGSAALKQLREVTERFSDEVDGLKFGSPVAYVYNPLNYARKPAWLYLERYASKPLPKRVAFLGMNPGPFGMVQTGTPFGEVEMVRDWMGIEAEVGKPTQECPKRPVDGFDCKRSEVSGRRLWGLFRDRFGSADDFFKEHFVLNYCPLAFLGETGRNLTPDKLAKAETKPLWEICDRALAGYLKILQPQWVVGVGAFAEEKIRLLQEAGELDSKVKIGKVLHPSPASPAANRDWAGTATRQLQELGIWL